eukprot:scaffold96284_cov50-Phaeocystis_antarctica.AAC.2
MGPSYPSSSVRHTRPAPAPAPFPHSARIPLTRVQSSRVAPRPHLETVVAEADHTRHASPDDARVASLPPRRPPPNNTLNTQSRAQQTHSRSRSLRAHPHRADPPTLCSRRGKKAKLGSVAERAHVLSTSVQRLTPLLRNTVVCSCCRTRRS